MECDVMAALFDDFVGTQHETSRHVAVDCLGGILTTSLNLLGCSTGRSPGLAPRGYRIKRSQQVCKTASGAAVLHTRVRTHATVRFGKSAASHLRPASRE